MIASFKFDWSYLREISQEKLDRLRAAAPELQLPEVLALAREGTYKQYTADIRKIIGLGAKIELGGDQEQNLSALLALDDKLDRLAEKMGKLQTVHEEHHHAFNAKCSVHVPGLGLLMIDQVDLLADGCTEKLAELMSEGWRILAICPQPDQRRPDYVIGKSANMLIVDAKAHAEVVRSEVGVF